MLELESGLELQLELEWEQELELKLYVFERRTQVGSQSLKSDHRV